MCWAVFILFVFESKPQKYDPQIDVRTVVVCARISMTMHVGCHFSCIPSLSVKAVDTIGIVKD